MHARSMLPVMLFFGILQYLWVKWTLHPAHKFKTFVAANQQAQGQHKALTTKALKGIHPLSSPGKLT